MKKSLGQYFTTNTILLSQLYNLIDIKNVKKNIILEPSFGKGDIIKYCIEQNNKLKFDCFEIDNTLKPYKNIKKYCNIIYDDFLKCDIDKLYKYIIGNPPYIKGKINTYLLFINKCYELLDNEGELIFILPYDFLISNNKYNKNLKNKLLLNGNITYIYHYNDEKLFDNANVDIIIIKYIKTNNLNNQVLYNDEIKYIINNDGIISFSNNKDNIFIKDIFNVYVGMVNGCEKVFNNDELGNIDIITSKNTKKKYIYINQFPTKNDKLNKYLLINKDKLLKRKIIKITENNWFKFGCDRNINIITNNIDKNCIYIHTLTRKKEISFIDKVNYFSGNLLLLIPKNELSIDELKKYNNYFNSDNFKNNYLSSGRFKIGQSQLLNSIINID